MRVRGNGYRKCDACALDAIVQWLRAFVNPGPQEEDWAPIPAGLFCESEDLTVFTMVVEDIGRSGEQRVSLHARGGDGPLQWLAANLRIGDAVRIEVVDLDSGVEGKHEELACSFCGRNLHDLMHLVEGPGVAIDACTVTFSSVVRNGNSLPAGATIRDAPEWVCGFCSKIAADVAGVIVRNGAAICPECLSACNDILRETSRDT